MSKGFEWNIADRGDVSMVNLSGSVDEDADFAPLLDELKTRGRIRIDLSGISRINSCGVREWVNFVRAIPNNARIELEKCTPVVVSQLNMISNFAGDASILSVKAPYVCDDCGEEAEILIGIEPGQVPELVAPTCESCGSDMEFDDIEDSYFAFLKQ